MTRTPNTRRTIVGAVGTLTLMAGLAACSTEATDAAGTVSPSASANATPTPTPTHTPVEWDPDASAAWADEVFPLTGTDQYVVYNSGQLAAARDGGSGVTAADTAPGTYELQLACQGDADSTITITATTAGAATVRLTAPCDETIQTDPFTLVNPGVTLDVSGTGDQPVLWAAVLATEPLG
ncbi:MAG: hypothetical protein ABWY68_04310 [Cryobacterium sp.]